MREKRSMPIQPPQTESSGENHQRHDPWKLAWSGDAQCLLRGSPMKVMYQRRNM